MTESGQMSILGHVPEPDADLLTATQVASERNVSSRTVRRWIDRGLLKPVVRMPGRTGAYLFARADVDALDEEQSS